MKTMNRLVRGIVPIVLLLLAGASCAQEAEFRWAKSFHGRLISSNSILKDNITSVKTDSVGNLYVFGSFGQAARIEEDYICPMENDTNYANANTAGIFLAKFDTLGTMQWCRSARYRGNGYGGNLNNALDMTIKNGKIYILGELTYESNWNWSVPDWCWFFDTLYVCPECYNPYDWPYMDTFPFREVGNNYVFVVFDMDGNKQEHHTLQLFVDAEGLNGDVHIAKSIRGRFVLDSDDNILLFVNSNMYWDSIYTPYLIVDDDTHNRISLGLEHRFNSSDEQLTTAMLWKIDRDWQHVECKQLIDSVAGWSRRFKVDSVYNPNSHIQPFVHPYCAPIGLHYNGITIDEYDRVYLSGYMYANDQSAFTYYHGDTLQELTFPCHFFLDTVHYLTAENLSMLGRLPYVVQYNRDGDVLWCNQLYSESQDTMLAGIGFMGNCIVDSNKLYVEATTESFFGMMSRDICYVFFDSTHLDTFQRVLNYVSGQCLNTASYAIYDRETGVGIAHHTIDTHAVTLGWRPFYNWQGCSDTKSDYLVSHIERDYIDDYADQVVKYNKRTGVSTISQSMVTEYSRYRVGYPSLYVHPHGFIIRTSNGSAIHQSEIDTTFHGGCDPAFLLFYYDSTLDCRRPHATPPTPPDPPDTTAVHPAEPPAVSFALNPNPTTGEVTVTLPPLGEGAVLTVADASGREVRRTPLEPAPAGSRLRLDLNGLPAGTYFVTLTTPQGICTKRILVIKN